MLNWINSSGHVMRKEIDSQGAAGEASNQYSNNMEYS